MKLSFKIEWHNGIWLLFINGSDYPPCNHLSVQEAFECITKDFVKFSVEVCVPK